MTRRQLLTGTAALFAYATLPKFAWAADALPAARLPYGGRWEGLVGVSGGIPTDRTRYGSTLPTSSTAAQINAAIAACPSGQYVELAAGTFNLSGNITIAKSNVTLKGAVDANGAPATVFNFSNGSYGLALYADQWWLDAGLANEYTNILVNSGHTRGSSSVVLASTPSGLAPGMLMIFSAPPSSPTIENSDWSMFQGAYPWTQIVKVTAVSGNTVSFSPAINADYISGLNVRAHYRTPAAQISRSGVENVAFQVSNGAGYFDGSCIDISGTDQCWVKNCKITGLNPSSSANAHISGQLHYRTEIRHCEISGASSNSSSTYCLMAHHSSNLLVVDNYFHDIANIWPMMGVNGSAFAYNYMRKEVYASPEWLSQIVFFHGSHSHHNLFEGNWIPSHFNDLSGSGNYAHSRNNTYFRERLTGWDEYPSPNGKTSNCHGISFQTHHDNVSVAGCVMGTQGVQSQYLQTSGSAGGTNSIFNADSTTRATMTRKGNYNTVDNGVPAAEALASGETIPDSYLFGSKPSWFGSLPWPPISPTNFTQSNNPRNLPAGYRAFNGGKDPGSSGEGAPAAPTNVRIG